MGVENCRSAIESHKLRQVCMPCNCHLFHDTCSLTYTAGGGLTSVGNQDACPSAPPSFYTAPNNVCGVCVCEHGVPVSGPACVKDGSTMCLACDEGYKMQGSRCVPSSCDRGYMFDGSRCVEMQDDILSSGGERPYVTSVIVILLMFFSNAVVLLK